MRDLALATHVSATTIRRASSGGPMEADGVFCLLRWLNLPAEVFLTGAAQSEPGLPRDSLTPLIARVDTKHLYAVLEERRSAKGLSWNEVAGAISMPEVTASTLKRLASGGRTEIHRYMAICDWLGVESREFVREMPN